jgi:vitamin B12 transporter
MSRPVRRRRRLAPLVAGCLLVAGPPAAHAQQAARLDPLVVTASRMPQRLTDLLADVTVITGEELRRGGAQSLAELLQRQPGVEIVQNGGPGASSGVFLRGANAAQTLVLVDGLRIASSTAGAAALEAIPLDQVERIEILRGPSSSLYGADAIGGVVQVFTRAATRAVAANASLGYGTHDTWIASAGASGGDDRARGSVQLSGRRSAGFNAIVAPSNFSYDPDRDGHRDASVSAQGVLALAPDHDVAARYFRSRLDSQFDAGDAFDDRTITTLTAWQVAMSDRFSATWQSRLAAGEGQDESVSRTAFGAAPFRTRQRQYAWQNDVVLDPARLPGRVTVALERREERVATDPEFAVRTRTTDSVTAVYATVAGPHALQANARHDHSSQYGGRTTGALAYGWQLAPAWRLTLGASTGFKAPTFNDLYYPGFSNPGLRPETARNVEAGVHTATTIGDARVDAAAVAWHNRVRDLIVFQCDADFVCAPANVADATLDGVTFSVDAVRDATTVRATLTVQSPEDDATGHLLPRRARRHGSVQWLQQAGPVQAGVELVASSRRFDDAANTRPMGGYGIVNVTLEWPVSRRIGLFLRADNVLDRRYELAADYATGGARVFGGVRWRL